MLYIITGANGAGKTLNGLKWCKELADKTARPVCHNGRFEVVDGGPLVAWKRIEFKDWQKQPPGTIFFIDEAHNDLPVRRPGSEVPEWVRMLAEHRKDGYDFFLVTQHPLNLDAFVRRLVGSPGWHRHLKRAFGADLVSCLEWSSVNQQCEKAGSGESGSTSMIAFPKEVYGWYRSAMLHTGKRKIPKAVYIVAAAVVLVPALMWFALSTVFKSTTAKADPAKGSQAQGPVPAQRPQQGPQAGLQPTNGSGPVGDYFVVRQPRIAGLPHTAPVYDEVTRPQDAPFPAACLKHAGKDDCSCFTQQGTRMPSVPDDLCRQIVTNGYFMEWHREATGQPPPAGQPMPTRDGAASAGGGKPQAAPPADAAPQLVAASSGGIGGAAPDADAVPRHVPIASSPSSPARQSTPPFTAIGPRGRPQLRP